MVSNSQDEDNCHFGGVPTAFAILSECATLSVRFKEGNMELEQWIAVYSAASQSAASRERSLWSVFAGGLIASSLLLTILAIVVALTATDLSLVFGIGIAALGLTVCLIWALIQYTLLHECLHWQRLLRSVESQFAGAEFHRSLDRLSKGEELCIPSASRICDEWNSEAAKFPWLIRIVPQLTTLWVPAVFIAGFVAFLIGISIR